MYVFLHAREVYGANYNRVTLEMAQVPTFAQFIKDAPSALGNWISNPITRTPLPRDGYDFEVHAALGNRIAATLGISEDWWHD